MIARDREQAGAASARQVYIAQGEFAVGGDPGLTIAAVLGSCVSTCLFDPERGIGGMNHILLPSDPCADRRSALVGANLMELLVNALLKEGARRSTLQAKVFGGARMFGGLGRAGALNADFALGYLAAEGIACLSHDLGGTSARRVEFHPSTGRARVRRITGDTPPESPPPPRTNTVELF